MAEQLHCWTPSLHVWIALSFASGGQVIYVDIARRYYSSQLYAERVSKDGGLQRCSLANTQYKGCLQIVERLLVPRWKPLNEILWWQQLAHVPFQLDVSWHVYLEFSEHVIYEGWKLGRYLRNHPYMSLVDPISRILSLSPDA